MTNPKIILMRGIQGSGKTTRAREIVRDHDDSIRVSRDDLRMQLYGTLNGPPIDEDLITEVETAMVRAALREGQVVVIDAMHLQQRFINKWQRLGYPVEIVECHADLEALLTRNFLRVKQVPESVIKENYQKFTNKDGSLKKVRTEPDKYVTSVFPKYETFRDEHLPEAFAVDIDGTLAFNDGHRSFYDYSKVYDDKVHYSVASAVNDIGTSHHIVILSGRKSESFAETERWLRDNNIRYDVLYMRDDGDDRPDSIVKYEMLRDLVAPFYDVIGVFDDRPSVCEMWRNIGLPTFQVGDPENRF